MCKVIAVTNRRLCKGDFEKQVRLLVECNVDYIVLREKDLKESEYEQLAKAVMELCEGSHTVCVLHKFVNVAQRLKAEAIHLSVPDAKTHADVLNEFKLVGVSTHSVEQVKEAQECNADYVFFGHVYQTECKKGVAPRGIEQLKEICYEANVPVYAIGGINTENAAEALQAGADGICVMSFGMQASSSEIAALVKGIKKASLAAYPKKIFLKK